MLPCGMNHAAEVYTGGGVCASGFLDHVYQIRFKNCAANAYLAVGSERTILIDVGLSSKFPHLLTCLDQVRVTPSRSCSRCTTSTSSTTADV